MKRSLDQSPPSLLSIVIAARRGGDRQLERNALRDLHRLHGIRVSFCRPSPAKEARNGK